MHDESLDEFLVREDQAFNEALVEYPLLARIRDFYQDAHFAPTEIDALRAELARVQKLRLDDHAKEFLNGMIQACETAAAERLGIRLLSS